MKQSLCVFCGSSPGRQPTYRTEAEKLGRLLAAAGISLVYGGGHLGLMGAVAQACLDAGGHVVGIIPRHLMHSESAYLEVSELIVVESMHERKKAMYERADGFAVLPGGLGTLDETFEILTWKQIRLHNKPVLLVDLGGFWQPMLGAIQHAITEGFTSPQTPHLYRVVDSIAAVPATLRDELHTAQAGRSDQF